MTVGVGILNRSGVALAADSFAAVEEIETRKFVSINKIFALSKYHTVGIMLDDSVRFMDAIPWETIIEVYSSYIGDKSFDTLQEYAEDFIKFLPNDNRFYSSSVEKYLIELVFDYCLNEVGKTVELVEDNEKAISDEVEKRIISFSKEKFLNMFDDSFIKLFLEKHRKDLKQYIENKVEFNIDIKTEENLIIMCAYVISKGDYMINSIYNGGVVISGYGDKEIFPSLYQYKILAIIDGRLIYKLIGSYNIGAEEDEDQLRKKIIPFGQKDVINTYINGINSNLKDNILTEIKNIFDNFLKEIQNKYNNNDVLQQFIDKEKDKINNIGMLVMEDLKKKIEDLQQTVCIDRLLYMVDVLRKEDMISLAEALVNLTSISGRFTTNEETEGGPIDVAIITKGEGFVWIKRKQIFNQEFNDIDAHTLNS